MSWPLILAVAGAALVLTLALVLLLMTLTGGRTLKLDGRSAPTKTKETTR